MFRGLVLITRSVSEGENEPTCWTHRVMKKSPSLTLRVGLIIVMILTFAAQVLQADDARARFYDQLRQRKLFSLVESDCLMRLAGRSLSERDRSDLTLELSRTYTAHAWQTIGAEQDDLWQRGQQVLSPFLNQSPKPARYELFETQWALIDLNRAEWLLAQSELRVDDRTLKQKGLLAAQAAIDRLSQLEGTLNKEARAASLGSASGNKVGDKADKIMNQKPDAPLTPFERRSLSQQIRLRWGTARLVQSKLSDPGSVDRAAAIVAADELLSPLAAGTVGESVTSESQLLLAEVARLRGDLDREGRILTAIEKSLAVEGANDLRERFIIERVRWWLGKRQPAEAAAFLIEQRKGLSNGGATPATASSSTGALTSWSPELSYWQVIVELALWRIASERGDAKLANDLWERLQSEVTRIEQESGGYWAARTKNDWQAASETQQYGSELAALVRRAKTSFSSQKTDDSLKLFGEAIVAAKAAKQRKLLLELADTRASLLFQVQRFGEAASAFQELAEAPRHERSAATHLLWAFCLGKLFDKEPTDEHRTEFVEALTSLSERYPKTAEAAEAVWMLGQLAERQQRLNEAIGLYATIPNKHARSDAAWAAIARCHERLIAQLRSEKKPTVEAEERAITQLHPAAQAVLESLANNKSQTADPKPRPVDSESDGADLKSEVSNSKTKDAVHLTRYQSELLVRLARLLLERQPISESQSRPRERADENLSVDRLLESSLAFSRDVEWRKSAGQLRVISLAGQRKIDEAEKLLDSLEEAGPDELLAMLDGLTAVSVRCDATTRRFVAELQLKALQDLAVSTQQELTATQRTRLWRARAEAYAATGQVSKAITASEQLLENTPRDAKLLRSMAELCELLETNAANKQAKGYWRRLEGLLKSGSPDWLDARWHVIRCCQKLGEKEEADKLLKVTKLLYPDLGGAPIKAKFDSL